MMSAVDGSTPDRIRTCDLRFRKPLRDPRNSNTYKILRHQPYRLAHHLPTDKRRTDPDLAAIVDAWPELPEAIRDAITAMVKATRTR